MTAKIRASTVDGIFYPDTKEELHRLVSELLEQSDIPAGKAGFIVSPHAAYRYSGEIAAAAFRSCSARKVENVLLLGPVHREPVEGIILPESEMFQTPLGSVTVNHELLEELQACGTKFVFNDIPHLEEHCLEVQLPFIQALFPDALIVPVLIAGTSPQLVRMLSNALQLTFFKRFDTSLFVVSANISYGRRNDAGVDRFLDLITAWDWEGILSLVQSKAINSCGATSLAAILSLLKERREEITILKRGSVGKGSDSAHYAAIILAK